MSSCVQVSLSNYEDPTGHLREKLITSLSHIKASLFQSTLMFKIKNLSFYFCVVCSLVIIFVFMAPRNKIKDNLKVLMDWAPSQNIFKKILGALQPVKLIKTSGACFCGTPCIIKEYIGKAWHLNPIQCQFLATHSIFQFMVNCNL